MKRKYIIGIAAVVLLVATCLWYTDPMHLRQDSSKRDTIEFAGKTLYTAELSPETLEWLTWYNSLPEDDQLKISFIPPELYEHPADARAEETGPA